MTDFPTQHDAVSAPSTTPDAASASAPTNAAPAPAKAKKRAASISPWKAADYSGLVSGSGAVKLASSAVAPLVAAARGYTSVTPESAEDYANRRNLGDRRSKTGRQFRNLFGDAGDVLILPWASIDGIPATEEQLDEHRAMLDQLRPSNPRTNEHGKPVKYEFLTGTATVLDTHPAVTRAWFQSAPRTLIAEGLLKGDSAISAQLRAFYSDDQLRIYPSDLASRPAAARRLHALLAGIPQGDRVAVMSIVGVGNWRQNSEWFGVNFKGKEVLVAFDGDVENNYNVWSMAADLYRFLSDSKGAKPSLVRMASNPTALQALEEDPKLGLDDFFARYGAWADLESMIEIDLPERPSRGDQAEIGDWKVSADGMSTQEYVEVPTTDGGFDKGRGRWVKRVDFGARIIAMETHRAPTAEELDGAPFGTGAAGLAHQSRTTIEVAWDAGNDVAATSLITGPSTLLHHTPADWPRHGAAIPDDVLLQQQWPPRKGPEWLGAVKAHRPDENLRSTVWATMGWVPVPDSGSQAFIAGRDVIASTETRAEQTQAGVLGNVLTNAERFGLHDVYTGPNLTDPTGKHNLADDVREVIDTYFTNSPWLNEKIAATMLAIALRPAVPLPTSVASYFVGAPQKGKSWSARHCMSFWQKTPGVWKHTLPGSANDTFATTESAIARTPIWVVDDLAPTSDRRTAEMQEAKIGDLIRAVHNKLGKRRMSKDMTEREVPTPMALTVITAENESSVQSIRERVVNVEFTGLRLAQMNRADELANKTTTASRVTAAIIRMFITEGEEIGWSNLVDVLRGTQEAGVDYARDILGELGISTGDSSRPAGMAADLALGLHALKRLMRTIGMDDEADKIDWSDPEDWYYLLTEQVSLAHRNKAEVSPGRVLVDCIRGLLASGAAHIANVDNPSAPPISGENSVAANALMGWAADSQGEFRPRGATIGFLTQTTTAGTDEAPKDIIWVLPDDAFQLAQQKYPKRIPYGASPSTAWGNFWDLGLAHPRYNGDGRPGITRQFRVRATAARLRGVPMSMGVLFTADPDEDGEV